MTRNECRRAARELQAQGETMAAYVEMLVAHSYNRSAVRARRKSRS